MPASGNLGRLPHEGDLGDQRGILQVQLGRLVERGRRVDPPVEHRLERGLVRPAEERVLEEGLRIALAHQALLDQQHHRVDVARGRRGIHEGHRLAAQVLDAPDAAVLPHVEPGGVGGLAAPDVAHQDAAARLAIGEDIAHRMHEGQVHPPAAEGLDHSGVVRGHQRAHRHPRELGQRLGEGIPRVLERGRIARRGEDERERRGLGRHRSGIGDPAQQHDRERREDARERAHARSNVPCDAAGARVFHTHRAGSFLHDRVTLGRERSASRR